MDGFEKTRKNLKNDMIVLFILELIIFVVSIYSGNMNLFSLGFAIFLFLGFILAKSGAKGAGIIGTIVGILMMLTILSGDIIDCLLGVFVFSHSVKYLKLF